METLKNFVNGEFVLSHSDVFSEIIDPCTAQPYLHAPISGAAEVDIAVRAAATGFETWRSTTPTTRQLALLQIADELERRADEFTTAEIRNTGNRAASEVSLVVDQLRFFAGAARILEGRAAGEYLEQHTSYVRREPIGVCVQLAPWNYPLMMAVLKVAPAVAAGNTVVLKPAETTPVTALMFAQLAAEYLPAGVVNVICGGDDTGRRMVEHPTPSLVSLTGSVETGIEVARAAATHLKQSHLELGGKAPVIVFPDADVTAATDTIIEAGFANAGQDCTAATRILAHRAIYDELVDGLTVAAGKCRTGPPSDPAVLFGPVNNARQLQRVSGFLDRLPAHARVLTGGEVTHERGYFFQPTVVADVRQDDEITQKEIFGPVITVQPFDTEADAVRYANGVDYGLAAGVWTRDDARALRLSRQLDYGTVRINTHLAYPSEMPHGGFKHSGYGKDLSTYSMDNYTRIKHVVHRIGDDHA
ncbi:aminobutyraldehyde dehydrogenase [Saccharomonospora sp. NPDC046836]|uniref:aminobutyraldehyde dehydrogenase n=1 Tax=Saccharomonospora sp. NPDC046836 TaxID=3156921 RepID=UPI003407E09C